MAKTKRSAPKRANPKKKPVPKKLPAKKIVPIKKMGLTGIAKQIAPIVFITLTATILLTIYFPKFFAISFIPRDIQLWIGFIILLAGIIFYLFTIPVFLDAYSKKKLITTGPYGLTRHPIYATWVVSFLPALIFLTNSWLFILADFIFYIMIDLNIHLEERHLIKTYGQKYKDYMEKVHEIFPWPKR